MRLTVGRGRIWRVVMRQRGSIALLLVPSLHLLDIHRVLPGCSVCSELLLRVRRWSWTHHSRRRWSVRLLCGRRRTPAPRPHHPLTLYGVILIMLNAGTGHVRWLMVRRIACHRAGGCPARRRPVAPESRLGAGRVLTVLVRIVGISPGSGCHF